MTEAEFDALSFFQVETMDKVESASDQQYIDDYNKHRNQFTILEKKFRFALTRKPRKKK